MPRFSVVIPVYNSYNLLEKCLETLEEQTYKDFEVVIVDDCSTDNSFEKLQNYSQDSKLNFHVFKNDKNSGPGETRNNGIRNATGEYVIFIDSDDYIETNSLELINKVIEKLCFENYEKRRNTQPYNLPSAGSVFKKPSEGISAPILIENCSLKGLKCGGAQISTKHCGFIVNYNNKAKCDNVLKLIGKIKKTVFEKYGIILKEEIIIFK